MLHFIRYLPSILYYNPPPPPYTYTHTHILTSYLILHSILYLTFNVHRRFIIKSICCEVYYIMSRVLWASQRIENFKEQKISVKSCRDKINYFLFFIVLYYIMLYHTM